MGRKHLIGRRYCRLNGFWSNDRKEEEKKEGGMAWEEEEGREEATLERKKNISVPIT